MSMQQQLMISLAPPAGAQGCLWSSVLWRNCYGLLGLLVNRYCWVLLNLHRSRGYSSVVEHLRSMCKVSLTEFLNQKRSRTGKKIMCYSGLKSLWSVSFQDNKFLVHCHPKLTVTFLLNASFNRAKYINYLELFRLTMHKHYRISSETLN